MANKLIKFSTEWCPPCKKLKPVFEKVSAMEDLKTVTFEAVDIDKDSDAAVDNNVEVIPTLVMFKDGKEVARRTGYVAEAELIKWIKDNSK